MALARLGSGGVARGAGRLPISGSERLRRRALFELFGGGERSVAAADETVPAPEIALAADEALAGLQLRDERSALCTIDEAALREAGAEFGGGFDEIG